MLVLVDAPCSGLGVIRKKPEIRYKDPAALAGLPSVQRTILDNVSRYVKPGGVTALLHLHAAAGGKTSRWCDGVPGAASRISAGRLSAARPAGRGGRRPDGDPLAPAPWDGRLFHLAKHERRERHDN